MSAGIDRAVVDHRDGASAGARLLAVIDLGERGAAVARHAVQIAHASGGTAMIGHVVDYTPGYETDHWPFLTPSEMEAEMVKLARSRFGHLLRRHGLYHAQHRVVAGRAGVAVAELATMLRADVIVVGSHATFGQDRRDPMVAGVSTYKVLVVPTHGGWVDRTKQFLGGLWPVPALARFRP